jgi:hypothetical protein
MNYLWPIVTGITFLDVWTLPHLGFWIFVGSTFWAFRERIPKWIGFAFCFSVAIEWELFEKYAEHIWPERWTDPESWVNSWLSDPLTCIVGYVGIWWLLDRRMRRAQW